VKYLVEKGADINIQDKNGKIPYQSAICDGFTEIGIFLKEIEHKMFEPGTNDK